MKEQFYRKGMKIGAEYNFSIFEGVYAAVTGPCLETLLNINT